LFPESERSHCPVTLQVTLDFCWNRVGKSFSSGEISFTFPPYNLRCPKLASMPIHHIVQHHRAGDQIPILDPLFLLDRVPAPQDGPAKRQPVGKLMVGFNFRGFGTDMGSARSFPVGEPGIRALLDGRKTQDRRLIRSILCPYGKPGDLLWVEESCWQDGFPGAAEQKRTLLRPVCWTLEP
jgi:hypothetical protein